MPVALMSALPLIEGIFVNQSITEHPDIHAIVVLPSRHLFRWASLFLCISSFCLLGFDYTSSVSRDWRRVLAY